MKQRPAATLALAAVLWAVAGAAGAIEPALPDGARVTFAETRVLDRYAAPVGVWSGQRVAHVTIDGAVTRRAWRIAGQSLTPLLLIDPLRAQLREAGYRIVLDCAGQTCGGYDFRFAVEVLPAPEMAVNLRSFHVVTALKGQRGAPTEAINIITSTRDSAGHLQIIEVVRKGDVPDAVPVIVPDEGEGGTATGDGLAQALAVHGYAVLAELDFESGTSALGAGPFTSLRQLAETLRAAPDMRVAVVGHTDTVGSLETNIVLSRARAGAVRQRLIDVYEIDPARLEAEGMGYLSPLTTNATQTGREANRRVEVIVLSR